MTDQVVRQQQFRAKHPEITFEVERNLYLNHRASWRDPDSGDIRSVASISLAHLLDELERDFPETETGRADVDGHPSQRGHADQEATGPKAGGSSVTAS